MEEWYVLKTKPRAEQQVEVLLSLRNAEHYLPMVRSRRHRLQTEPLFPGYLFCHLEIPSVKWVEVRSLPGVAYVLSADGKPTPVPEDLVASVRSRVELENAGRASSRFSPGDRVRILRGPFQGLEAAFDKRLSASGRSRVLISLLRRLVPLEIDEFELARAG